MDEKEKLIKGRNLVEIVGHDWKKDIWEVQDDHVVDEATDNDILKKSTMKRRG